MGTTTTTSTRMIMRRSIFSFLQEYQYFTSTPSLLALPFAISTLLSQSLVSSSDIFPLIHTRLRSLFLAAGFPLSLELFSLLNLKLSQTILTFLFVSPFTYTFLLLAKASVIKTLDHNKTSEKTRVSSWISLFAPLLITQLCNSLVILAANATCFFLLVIFINFLYALGLSSAGPTMLVSAAGVVLYSIVLANAYIVSNLALVSSGMEKDGGFISILKACVIIQGTNNATALSLAVPMNMALAAIEALFQYRITGAYNNRRDVIAVVIEGMLVAYLYALLLVLDTVVGCVFWRVCKKGHQQADEEEEMYSYKIKIEERDGRFVAKSVSLEDTIP